MTYSIVLEHKTKVDGPLKRNRIYLPIYLSI
jgi:hypothetical protein